LKGREEARKDGNKGEGDRRVIEGNRAGEKRTGKREESSIGDYVG
jgi:hypothetical protein